MATQPSSDEYIPADHRTTEHPISATIALIHLLKGSLGSGILAMAMAFANAGLYMGLFLTVFVGFICGYCLHILVTSAHILYKRMKVPSLTYDQVAEAAFLAGPPRLQKWGKISKFMVNLFLVIDLLGCCSVYVLFVGRNIKQVIDTWGDYHLDVRIYMASLLPLLIVTNLIRNLKFIAPFSLVANFLVFAVMVITFYYIFIDLPSVSEREGCVSILRWPMFFGTSIFALECIGVVMPLENTMSAPSQFTGCPGVLPIAMSTVVILYASIGFFGYLKYGEKAEASITLNLPRDEKLAQSVKLMIAIAIFFTFALQFYVPMGVIWRGCKHYITFSSEKRENMSEYALRVSLVTFTVALAIAVPNLGGFISLVGAVCLSFLGLIFPAIIELVTVYEEPGFGRFKWILWKDIFLMLFGLLGFFTGTYVSIKEIIDTWDLQFD